MPIKILGAIAVAIASLSSSSAALRAGDSPAPACTADPNYQRLAFWVGDWDVVDSAGAHYATQRVHAALDGCAIVAEWESKGNKGLNVSSFDPRAGEWRQMYLSNQVPTPSGVSIRRSDPSYGGPGVRFISLVDSAAGTVTRSRVTILPMDGGRVMQLFEDSNDGVAWHVLFRAEHRRMVSAP